MYPNDRDAYAMVLSFCVIGCALLHHHRLIQRSKLHTRAMDEICDETICHSAEHDLGYSNFSEELIQKKKKNIEAKITT